MLLKHIQIIAQTLLVKIKLGFSASDHVVLHATVLIRIHLTALHTQFALQLVIDYEPNISYLRTFGCAVQVPISPPQRTKMGLQRRLGIYVDIIHRPLFDS